MRQETMNSFTPLKDYIHNVTGYDIELYVATDYTGVITAMQSKKVDVAFFGPLSYAMANHRASAVAFAEGYNTYNRSFYYSYMLATPEVASALGITSSLQGTDGMKTLKTKLDSHKGQYTYSFVDPASTSGYGIPRAAMAMAGIDPAVEFKKTGFARRPRCRCAGREAEDGRPRLMPDIHLRQADRQRPDHDPDRRHHLDLGPDPRVTLRLPERPAPGCQGQAQECHTERAGQMC